MQLESATAAATFSLTRGGRLGSLVVHGHELLLTAADDLKFGWGSFPMVPYAGRVVHGRFCFEGVEYDLPITKPPHAIHGTVWNQPWHRIDDAVEGEDRSRGAVIRSELGPEWPFGGSVEQRIELADDHLGMTLAVTAADRPMPAMVGWHPWFRRRLLQDRSIEVGLRFVAAKMYERDDAMVPSGRLIDPSPGPWDDCFAEVAQPLTLTWPGAIELSLISSCDHWVVYDHRPDGICVEPQSDAPDAFNRAPHVLAPGETLEETFTIRWSPAKGGT
jgi:aldose 1-epimerase